MISAFNETTQYLTDGGLYEKKPTLWHKVRHELNFFRVHVLFFTFTPLLFSGIFYASNGEFKISYIDSLFNCVSAMTVCGLVTVNLSSLTGWQQTILFLQMCMGSPVVVSWVIVLIRKYYFAKKFKHVLDAAAARRHARIAEFYHPPWRRRLTSLWRSAGGLSDVPEESRGSQVSSVKKQTIIGKLKPDMIRRMDHAPRLINPSGGVAEPSPRSLRRGSMTRSRHSSLNMTSQPDLRAFGRGADNNRSSGASAIPRRLSIPESLAKQAPTAKGDTSESTVVVGKMDDNNNSTVHFPRAQTIEFAPSIIHRRESEQSRASAAAWPVTEQQHSPARTGHVPLSQFPTGQTNRSPVAPSLRHSAKMSGFGGFPMPYAILKWILSKLFPKVKRTLTRTVTMPATTSYVSQPGMTTSPGVKIAPYLTFDAVVGRNSTFQLLTSEQLNEIGGVEYRALNALLWIVAFYHIGVQIVSFTVIAPYMSTSRWKNDFVPPMQYRVIPPAWFSAFQVVSSYTNSGMSLVDQSMVPFQRAYPLIIFMVFLILAGNTAFPIFLRFTIWVSSKFVANQSRINETLRFLLDHPRRCFIYLFPSHQTWFLLTVVLGLTLIDWFFFVVLDINNQMIDQIPLNIRVMAGLLQAVAVRTAGFGIVPLAALAPAVKVLYVIMMYISIYPIAMSVRSTNVYEEQSLGIFHPGAEDEEPGFEPTGPRMTVWSRYLAMHARRQLAFDMWWLCLALFLVCIIERQSLENPDNFAWFTIFSILFELVSAYGTVGLSLGIPGQNYSLSGAFRPLSKLIVCLVMLRGRHHGLPVAIDRAVMLPVEFERMPSEGNERERATHEESETSARRYLRTATMESIDGGQRRRRSWMNSELSAEEVPGKGKRNGESVS